VVLEFDGTDFRGWQRQNDVRTVEGDFTTAVRKALNEDAPEITGCSRTDAGVHALGYCANFRTSAVYPARKIKPILNSHVPDDISVLSAADVPDEFNARHSVLRKTYRYSILNTPEHHPLQRRTSWTYLPPLDTEIMKQGAELLAGEHDFSAFCGKLEQGKSPVRLIESIDIGQQGPHISISVTGRSFLYRMVRIITGTLVDAGRGNITVSDIKTILDSRDKNLMRAAAPAQGLTLVSVEYQKNTADEHR
jgi:tRNA pseudouridine38-40 synthase